MTNSYLVPYFLLLIAVILGWRTNSKLPIIAVVGAIVSGLAFGRLEPVSIISITALGLSIGLARSSKLSVVWRSLCYAVFFVLAIAMSNYMVPGFKNLSVYDQIQFSKDSVPFTMYLNFDKILVGLFIYLFYLKPNQIKPFQRQQMFFSIKVLALLIILLMPIALAIHYVHFDPKFPPLGWIWVINNLFFVCLAEEGLFRGLIQGGLSKLLPKTKAFSFFSIIIASLLFGLAHYTGGPAYIALAGIAGLFYGYAYWKTERIESSVIVHFGLNSIHFLFFSYPALNHTH
jgi:uncharacterized protein